MAVADVDDERHPLLADFVGYVAAILAFWLTGLATDNTISGPLGDVLAKAIDLVVGAAVGTFAKSLVEWPRIDQVWLYESRRQTADFLSLTDFHNWDLEIRRSRLSFVGKRVFKRLVADGAGLRLIASPPGIVKFGVDRDPSREEFGPVVVAGSALTIPLASLLEHNPARRFTISISDRAGSPAEVRFKWKICDAKSVLGRALSNSVVLSSRPIGVETK